MPQNAWNLYRIICWLLQWDIFFFLNKDSKEKVIKDQEWDNDYVLNHISIFYSFFCTLNLNQKICRVSVNLFFDKKSSLRFLGLDPTCFSFFFGALKLLFLTFLPFKIRFVQKMSKMSYFSNWLQFCVFLVLGRFSCRVAIDQVRNGIRVDGCSLGHSFICLFFSPFLWFLLYIQQFVILTILLYYKVLNLSRILATFKSLNFYFHT